MKMLKTVIKNLIGKKSTRLYPVQKREPFANVRGELVNDINSCIFCGMCSKKCPVSCITVDRAAKTWQHNPFECIYCGICVETCPKKCLSQKSEYKSPDYEKAKLTMTPAEKQEKEEEKKA